MAYDIFISYRRRGGFETAKHLYDLLTKDGYRVSFDIDTLRNGDFDTELLRRIDECRDFILILSEGALDRCVDPSAVASADWVRCELAYALEKNKNIVPIMLAGFTAFPDNLPDDIRKVVRKNGPKYDSYYFDDFYRRLKSDFLETKPEERGDEDAYVTQLLKRLSALKSVPDSYREGSFGLGAGRLRTVFQVVLPSAVPGILAGVILAVGRIVGETAALMYTAGTVAGIPANIMGSARTLSVHMYVLTNEGLYTNQSYATAVVLLGIVVLINALSGFIAKKITGKGIG